MQTKLSKYDCGIIGGGLAGLALSIQLVKKGFKVIVFEKEQYPFHKVCGEYVSLESVDFLKKLGIPLDQWSLPVMNKLALSAPSGKEMITELPLGGFGISRYKLDSSLAEIAKRSGVNVLEQTKVIDVHYQNYLFHTETRNGTYEATVCCGAFGKRSNLDIKWKRKFVQQKNKTNNFTAIKYHALLDHPKDTIALHNFKNGYCGISAIEENRFCICYLTNAINLHNNQNDIRLMEQNVLYKNPHLKKIFNSAVFLFEKPLAISQISFDQKQQIEDHILMIGDAAGMIAPLCGNGMSMALHSSKIAAANISYFLRGKIGHSDLERQYEQTWRNVFNKRLNNGRRIQQLFGKPLLTNIFIPFVHLFPKAVSQYIITKTHGKTF
jgi:flavin-dependent dehydrogenase